MHSRALFMTGSEWPAELLDFRVGYLRFGDRLARFVMGWVLLAIYTGSGDLVDKPHTGTGDSLAIALHLWMYVPEIVRVLWFPVMEENKTRWFSVAWLVSVAMGGQVFWHLDRFWHTPTTQHTVYRAVVNTAFVVYTLRLVSLVNRMNTPDNDGGSTESGTYVNVNEHSKFSTGDTGWKWIAYVHQTTQLAACACLLWYDRLPRDSATREPNNWLLWLGMLSVVAYFLLSLLWLYQWVIHARSAQRNGLLMLLRSIGTWVVILMWTVALLTWLGLYSSGYAAARDGCTDTGLPAKLRFAGTPTATENIAACLTKCGPGQTAVSPCPAQYYLGCCDSVTAVFTFGEDIRVREGVPLLLILLCIPVALYEVIVEGIALVRRDILPSPKRYDHRLPQYVASAID